MNVEEIAQAMVDLAQKKEMRLQMGENGYRRVMAKYRIEYMQETYWKIYRDCKKYEPGMERRGGNCSGYRAGTGRKGKIRWLELAYG